MESKGFVAAAVPPKLPRPVTRAAAAAATAADDADEGGEEHPHAPSSTSPASAEDRAFDYPFTVLVKEQAEAIKQAAMQAFSKPGSAPAGSNPMAQGSVEDAVASLPGGSEGQKLLAAVEALRRAEAEAGDLRAKNRALAEDLMRVTSGAAAQGGQAAPARSPSPLSHQAQASLAAASQAAVSQAQANLAAATAATAAEADRRVAAERRASGAEAEAAHYRQQLEVLVARLNQAERDAGAAQDAAANAYSAAAKHEQDLQDLSTAYNSLETHAHQLEGQIRDLTAQLTQQQQQQQQQAVAGSLTEAEVAQRVQQAVQQAVQEAQRGAEEQMAALRAAATAGAGAGAVGGGVSEAEVARRVEEAAAESKAQAEADSEEQLTDLLVCLGQEEQKVAVLREKLEGYGVDVEELLASIKPEDEEEEDGGLQ